MMYSAYKLNRQGDNIQALMYSFPDLESVSCYICHSNCCFLACIQISQEAGQVVPCSNFFSIFEGLYFSGKSLVRFHKLLLSKVRQLSFVRKHLGGLEAWTTTCCCFSVLSPVQLFVTPRTAAPQVAWCWWRDGEGTISQRWTHVHWVSDAIQPSYPLLSPSPPTFNLSQHQGLFQWVNSSHQVAKVLKFQLQHQSFQSTFRVDFL